MGGLEKPLWATLFDFSSVLTGFRSISRFRMHIWLFGVMAVYKDPVHARGLCTQPRSFSGFASVVTVVMCCLIRRIQTTHRQHHGT